MTAVELTVTGVDADLRVHRATVDEAMERPWSAVIDVAFVGARDAREAAAAALVGADGTLAWDLGDAGARTFEGVVDAVETRGAGWRLHLVHRARLLEDAIDHRVFVDVTIVDAVKEVLAAHGLSADVRVSASLAPRPQIVQAFESDLDFVRRLLAEEGIAWWCDPASPKRLVLGDAPSALDDAATEGPIPFHEEHGLVRGASILRATASRALRTERFAMRDFDFENPGADLGVTAGAADGVLERFAYRGRYTDNPGGERLARLRLEESRADALVLDAATSFAALAPGQAVALAGLPVAADVEAWHVLAVKHAVTEGDAADDERRYEAELRAVPKEAPYRPRRLPEATLGGLQTLDVTGPGGAEIHTEAYGRIKAHFRWDRRRPKDDTASAWMRTLQPPLSGGFLQPRTGWEVLASFYHGDADEPLELGRLFRATDPPLEGLPEQKVKSRFGTATTPGGGSENRIVFVDTAGDESMLWDASKDWNEKIEHDRVIGVTTDDTLDVGATRNVTIGQVLEEKIQGALTTTVSAERKVNVIANKNVKAGSETVMIGGARIFDVGGDQQSQSASVFRVVGGAKAQAHLEQQSTLVSGSSTVLVGGALGQKHGLSNAIAVGGVSREQVAGVKSVKARGIAMNVRGALRETYATRKITTAGDLAEEYGGTGTWTAKANANVKGADVVFQADSKIVIQASGATITITSGSVEIDADVKSPKKSKDKNDESYG